MEWMENGMYYKRSINTLVFVEIYRAGIRKRRGRGKVECCRLATAQSYLYPLCIITSPFLHSIK